MYELEQKYISKLEAIAGEIQESEELSTYLDTEEEEDFSRLKELYETKIGLLHEKVAEEAPLQLVSFELIVLDPVFEGLYLPRILGYSVLRGDVNNNFKYARPQEHFKEILLAICSSANFDILKKRIGQTIQIGFALSSDIWVTNLINEITNKRIRYFLLSQKLDRYRIGKERSIGYNRYKRQFKNENFLSAEFPVDLPGLKVLFNELKNFLFYRISRQGNNKSIIPFLKDFLSNESFQNTNEYIQVLALCSNFFEFNKEDKAFLAARFNNSRESYPEFIEEYLSFLLELQDNPDINLSPEADKSASDIVNHSIDDILTNYYRLTDLIHDKGYNNDEVHEAVKVFYNQYPGKSTVNNCVRKTIFNYFKQLISNLSEKEYPELFEVSKLFPIYFGIFANQQFNQSLKEICMTYIKKLLRFYTDKRGKDYQDIKKFVSSTFPELGFLKEKEIVELFKTKRKKKPSVPNQ